MEFGHIGNDIVGTTSFSSASSFVWMVLLVAVAADNSSSSVAVTVNVVDTPSLFTLSPSSCPTVAVGAEPAAEPAFTSSPPLTTKLLSSPGSASTALLSLAASGELLSSLLGGGGGVPSSSSPAAISPSLLLLLPGVSPSTVVIVVVTSSLLLLALLLASLEVLVEVILTSSCNPFSSLTIVESCVFASIPSPPPSTVVETMVVSLSTSCNIRPPLPPPRNN